MKTISLTRGYKTLVDNEDFEKLSRLKWHASTISAQDLTGPRAIRTERNNKISVARTILRKILYSYYRVYG